MPVVGGVVLASLRTPDAGLVVANGRVIGGFLTVSGEPDAESHADQPLVAQLRHITPEHGVPHTEQL